LIVPLPQFGQVPAWVILLIIVLSSGLTRAERAVRGERRSGKVERDRHLQ